MTINESCIGEGTAIKKMLDSNELLTAFHYNHGYQPCSMKILWKSQVTIHQSMIFPKESPLLPFFKYVYNKIRQNGALHRIKKKWVDIEYRSTCQSSPLQPISFHKIVSLFTLLFFGICWTFIILVIEVYSKKKISTNVKESNENLNNALENSNRITKARCNSNPDTSAKAPVAGLESHLA